MKDQCDFEVCGFWGGRIFFKRDDAKFSLPKSLPKADMIILLRVEEEECNDIRREIYREVQDKVWDNNDYENFVEGSVRKF